MLYLPSSDYLPRFTNLTYPLPHGLIPWLYGRGLSIYVLPEDPEKALRFVVEKLRIYETVIDGGDGRTVYDTAQYRPDRKMIIIPHREFHDPWGENPVMHEVAHAFDHLYYNNNRNYLCTHPYVSEHLRPHKPLNNYCERKYKQHGVPWEQFACSFCAFFQEPDKHRPNVNNITDLSTGLIKFFQSVMEYFDDNSRPCYEKREDRTD